MKEEVKVSLCSLFKFKWMKSAFDRFSRGKEGVKRRTGIELTRNEETFREEEL